MIAMLGSSCRPEIVFDLWLVMYMAWSSLRFGKYKGKTLPQVLFSDPDWFFWAVDDGILRGKGDIEAEADELAVKAKRIRIPCKPGEDLEAEYFVHRPTGRFGGVQVVPASRPLHEGSSPAWRRKTFDLSMPRQISQYDKTGCKLLLTTVKYHLFGKDARLTQKRCEDFFSDPANFA
jgi:hypothetical protein